MTVGHHFVQQSADRRLWSIAQDRCSLCLFVSLFAKLCYWYDRSATVICVVIEVELRVAVES